MFLKNINLEHEELVSIPNRHIFFIDGDGGSEVLMTNAKKACSVEAAALLNPDHLVHLIFLTPAHKTFLHHSSLIEALMQYDNINIRFMNANDFCNQTEIEEWIESDPFWKYSTDQVGLVMRILSVYKYGGVSMDFDTLSIRSISELNLTSFACFSTKPRLFDTTFKFDKTLSEQFSLGFFERLQKAFKLIPITYDEIESDFLTKSKDPQDPQVMFTSTVRSTCPREMSRDQVTKCDGIDVLPASQCSSEAVDAQKSIYNVHRESTPRKNLFFVKTLKVSPGQMFKERSRSIYRKLARKFCPIVTRVVVKY